MLAVRSGEENEAAATSAWVVVTQFTPAHMILGPDISTFVKKGLQENADINSLTKKGLPTIPTDASLVVDNIKFGAGIKSPSIVLLPVQTG